MKSAFMGSRCRESQVAEVDPYRWQVLIITGGQGERTHGSQVKELH